MSLSLSLTISRDELSPLLRDLVAKIQPDRLARLIRGPVEKCWREHLKNFPRLPGRFAAFPGTGFGEQASRAVRATASGATVTARCDKQGIRLRYHGGTIKPVNKKFLCFGIKPESYGKTPYDFGLTPGANYGRTSGFDYAARQRVRELFAFARQVTMRPNRNVIPPKAELLEVVNTAIVRALVTKGPAT